MSLTLSWDLFIIVFVAIVVTYSFIIGKNQAMKVIIATYISIIATQGISDLLVRLGGDSATLMSVSGMEFNVTTMSVAKIFMFALFIIMFMIRSGIEVSYAKQAGSVIGMLFTGLFGIATAGLIVSTILTYATVNGTVGGAALAGMQSMLNDSTLMQVMILNRELWFTFPALLIIGAGFVHRD